MNHGSQQRTTTLIIFKRPLQLFKFIIAILKYKFFRFLFSSISRLLFVQFCFQTAGISCYVIFSGDRYTVPSLKLCSRCFSALKTNSLLQHIFLAQQDHLLSQAPSLSFSSLDTIIRANFIKSQTIWQFTFFKFVSKILQPYSDIFSVSDFT